MKPLRIATRASRLALVQAEGVAARVRSAVGAPTELVAMRSTGDRLKDVSLAEVGGKGLFIKEIEESLLDGRADVAVHSAKDLPAVLTPGLVLAAFPERADPRDAFVARERGMRLDELPPGARVGTGSARRGAQLLAWRPDLDVVPLRGNVQTRIRKIESEGLHGVILACAGMDRLGLAERIDERIDPSRMLPAVGQGTLALQVREGDPLEAELAALAHAETAAATAAERAFLERLGGDCNVPLAAFAEREARGALRLAALVAEPDGTRISRGEDVFAAEEASAGGRRVAEGVLASGGAAILEALREKAGSSGSAP